MKRVFTIQNCRSYPWGINLRGQHGTSPSISASLTLPRFFAVAAIPQRARVVVCGGGIIGNSVAYHLAHMGCHDVVVLERHKLTSGTTWHAAGLMVTFGSWSETSTEFRKYSKDLYQRLEAETGQPTGFKGVGFIELASSPDRLEEFRRVSAINRKWGVEVEEISPSEVKNLFPLCRTDDILAGFYVPGDGRVNPIDLTMSLAKGARSKGVKIIEGISATGITTNKGAVSGVHTTSGFIEAEYVVNCMGMWARQFGETCGVSIPNQAAEHYYLLTEPISEVDPSWPVIEDPASYTYIRPEGGGLMVGMFEGTAAAWNVPHVPEDFSFGEISPDWDRMAPFLEKAMNRVPISLETGVSKLFCGPESFTPDLAPLVGEAPELRNYFVGAGLNSIGILTGGGVGRLLAHWIVNGAPDMDVTGINIDRAHKYQTNPQFRAHRVVESLGLVYKCHYPNYAMQSARSVKKTPLHDRTARHGAFFRDVSGWEVPDWYAGPGKEAVNGTLTWGRPDWFETWAAEHRACREGAALIDMSFMSKFFVQGRDAGRLLNWLSTADIASKAGQVTYTQWLNGEGTLEADLTVTKLDDSKYMVVATDTMHRHVESWMTRHVQDQHVVVTDVTGAYAMINIQGPRSRELMSRITSQDMSDVAFPFRCAKEIDIEYARALCLRITYVGELGYELYVPSEMASAVYDTIVTAGGELGLQHAGLKALGSLRMEKAYRDYGHDIDNTDTIYDVGLGFTCDFKKPDGFLGMDIALKHKSAQRKRRLVQVLVKDPDALMYHQEVLFRSGIAVGSVRSASYGHSLGGSVGLAMVESEEGSEVNRHWIQNGQWEVDIAGQRYQAQVSLRPLLDPANTKIKA